MLLAIDGWERLLLYLFTLFSMILSFLRVLVYGPFLFTSNEEVKERVPRFIPVLNLLLCAGLAGFSLGLTARILNNEPVQIPIPIDRVIGLSGILSDDPRAFNDGRGMGSLGITQVTADAGLRVSGRGRITVFFPAEAIPGLRDFGRGSEIYVEGTMIRRENDFLFRASGVYILKPAPGLEQFRTGFRLAVMEKFRIDNRQGNAPVWGGLASALLLGIRDNLDSDLTSAFVNAGCSHVLALSGMHLAILSSVIALVLHLFMGIKPASLIGAIFIVIYIFLAGAQPSLVRAGIMFLLGTLALWGYLKKNPLSILAIAFIIQIFIQKDSGTSVSFILSYLALIGILVTGKTIHELLRGRIPEILNQGFSASLGAIIATAAVTAYYFGVLRPIGIIASLIITPLASIFMILAFGTLVLISFFPILFEPLSNVLGLLYRLIEIVVYQAGRVPGLKTPNFIIILIVSLSLVFFLEYLKHRDRIYRSSIASFDDN